MPGRKWTEEETNLLIELFPKKRIDKIAEELGRSVSSIEQKAGRIRKSQGTLLRSKYWWSDEEIQTLIELNEEHTALEIGKILKRSPKSTRWKANELGLTKNKKWNEKRIKTLKKLWTTEKTVVEIASEMGISSALVSRMACNLQLPQKHTYVLHKKGFKGEKLAEKFFKQQGWKILRRGKRRGNLYWPAFDFIVETDKGEKYAINVKHGKHMHISMKNIERLNELQYRVAFVWITENRRTFFMPITGISSL